MWAGWDVEALAIHFSPFISGRLPRRRLCFCCRENKSWLRKMVLAAQRPGDISCKSFFASSFFGQDGQLSKLVFFNLQRKQELTGDFHPRWPQKGVKAARIFGDILIVRTICKTKGLFDH